MPFLPVWKTSRWSGSSAGGTEPIPRSLLIIDEFQEFFVEDDKISQTASLLLDRIVRQGRAFGIHVLLGSQTLGGAYTVGFTQTLMTGTNVEVDATMNRSSSNSNFSTLNPSWSGSLRYSFTQHLLRDFGRRNNIRQIRIAQNNEKISQVQFERQLIDLVAQAQRQILVHADECYSA